MDSDSVGMYVFGSVPWPVGAVVLALELEAVVMLALLPRLIRFYVDLLRGRGPSLSLAVCRRATAMIVATLAVTSVLAVFVALDFAGERAYSLAEPALRPQVTAAGLTLLLYREAAPVVLSVTLNLLALGVWLYAATYCRNLARAEPT